ncbi:basic leucine zipper 43-like [Magnolia sinica]|uniref:basic leucine zipper 43-like n=1 Tax=Magnolia sinica TaxID=86752 RepID=UPI002657AF31|nr:basic leucine zipper 43-like [Magnolia sinica]
MEPGAIAATKHSAPVNPTVHPSHFTSVQNNTSTFNFSRFFSLHSSPSFQTPPSCQFTSQTSSSLSNNSTSDDAEEHPRITDEKKRRRMISNRESARRSRIRQKKHLNELMVQVIKLRDQNCKLIIKLNHMEDCNDRILRENSLLREEASNLRQTLQNMQPKNPYIISKDTEEIPCNSTTYLGAKSTNQTFITPMALL